MQHNPKGGLFPLAKCGMFPKIVGFTPKWMVKIMEKLIINGSILGGKTPYVWKPKMFRKMFSFATAEAKWPTKALWSFSIAFGVRSRSLNGACRSHWNKDFVNVKNEKMPNEENDDFVVKSCFISERHACSIEANEHRLLKHLSVTQCGKGLLIVWKPICVYNPDSRYNFWKR